MKTLVRLAVLAIFLATGTLVYCQQTQTAPAAGADSPLMRAAKKERERREKLKTSAKPTKSFTNQDIEEFKAKNKDASVTDFNLKVVFGEKVSDFKVSPDSKGGVVHFENSNGEKRQKILVEKDFKFLLSEASKVKESNDKSLCDQRQFIEMKFGKNTKVGCLGSTTKSAKQLAKIANLLSLIVQ